MLHVVNSALVFWMGFSSSDPSLIKWCCGESPGHDSPISTSLFCVLMAGLGRAKYEVCWSLESRLVGNSPDAG